MLLNLEKEVEAMKEILLSLEHNVEKAMECANLGFDKLINTSIDVKFSQIYQEVTLNLLMSGWQYSVTTLPTVKQL